jgi:hypothetical protein
MATGTLTNANDAVAVPAREAVLCVVSGTYPGGPVVFEGSVDNGVTYPAPLWGQPGGGGASVCQAVLAANQTATWLLDTRAFTHARVRDAGGVGGAKVSLLPAASSPGGGGGPFAGSLQLASDVAPALAVYGAAATTTPAQLAAAAATRGVSIKADDDNTDSVYVGAAGTVTANKGVSTSGFRLKAGQAATFAVANANLLWVLAAVTGQNYTVVVL